MAILRWSDEELEAAIESGRPLLVDLQAEWCAQCRPQEKVLERLAPDFAGQVTIASVDVGQFPKVSDRFGIVGLPALLLFKDGKHWDTLCGFKRAPLIRQALSRLLKTS